MHMRTDWQWQYNRSLSMPPTPPGVLLRQASGLITGWVGHCGITAGINPHCYTPRSDSLTCLKIQLVKRLG